MVLALSLGNREILIGVLNDEEIVARLAIETSLYKTEFEYAVIISQILDIYDIDKKAFEAAIIASVVPQLTDTLKAAVKLVTDKTALIIGAGVKTGLNIGIDEPNQLGADLVCSAVAALSKYDTPLIIVDIGTATTLSVVSKTARFLGGAILSGANISLEALSEGASLLPSVAIEKPRRSIGRNTVECMKSGAVYGLAASIDGMIERFEDELGEKATLVSTGKLAGQIIPHCKREIVIDEDLVLHGLALVLKKNMI